MPRYFFNILHTDNDLVPDDEGGDFEDYQAAKHEAVESLRDLAAEAIKGGRKAHDLAIEIMDERGKVLGTIKARETFG